jgi:hypothetical protein
MASLFGYISALLGARRIRTRNSCGCIMTLCRSMPPCSRDFVIHMDEKWQCCPLGLGLLELIIDYCSAVKHEEPRQPCTPRPWSVRRGGYANEGRFALIPRHAGMPKIYSSVLALAITRGLFRTSSSRLYTIWTPLFGKADRRPFGDSSQTARVGRVPLGRLPDGWITALRLLRGPEDHHLRSISLRHGVMAKPTIFPVEPMLRCRGHHE